MLATFAALPLIGIALILALPLMPDSVATPRPFGFSATPSSSLRVLTYRRGAATGWLPRPNSRLRRLYSTPSPGLATAYTSIGALRPPTSLQLWILP